MPMRLRSDIAAGLPPRGVVQYLHIHAVWRDLQMSVGHQHVSDTVETGEGLARSAAIAGAKASVEVSCVKYNNMTT